MWQWFMLLWPLTYCLHPHLLSHTTPMALKRSPLSPGSRMKRPDPAQPGSARVLPRLAQQTPRSEICLSEQWKTDGLRGKQRTEKRKKKSRSLVKYLRRKITQRGCLIISICLVWFCWGGHVVSLTALWFIFHIIWSWTRSIKTRVG